MTKKEFKVGETFQCGLVKLRVEEGKGCCKCIFYNPYCFDCDITLPICGLCSKNEREDKTDVIFVKVEE
jgi:hypothetical protein